MKEAKIRVLVLFILLLGWILALAIHDTCFTNNTSSPVEEMYHKQLITTLDSILDARFGSGCREEAIDTVSISSNRRLISAEKFADIIE